MLESAMKRLDCTNDHLDPPYVVIEDVTCPDCGNRWKGANVDGEWLTYPFEHCAICLRMGGAICGKCEGPVLVAQGETK